MSDELQVMSNKNKYNTSSLKKSLVTCRSSLVTRFLLAFQFLTVIPIKLKVETTETEIAQSSAFFPIVGAFQGLMAFLSAFLLLKVFPPEITTGLIILLLIISNGGFHLDGLADTFDSLAVKSTSDAVMDREKRLSVMKDSTTGAIGVIALVITILLKYLFISHILHNYSLYIACLLLFLLPIFSRWTMIPAIFHGTPARQDGLGRIFLENIRINAVVFSSFLIIFFYILAIIISISLSSYKGIPFNPPLLKGDARGLILLFVILFVLLYIFSFMSAKFCIKKFGGLTGDNLGAISEISEILFLMATSIWLQHFI